MRQETTTRTLYQFDELSDSAKEKAREWFRDGMEVFEWSECVIDDAVTIGELFGLEINTRPVKLIGGSVRRDPEIYFDIYHRTIDFNWSYSYVAGSVKAVKDYAGTDTDLHQIVNGLQAIQKKNFYQLQASKGQYGVDVTRLDYKNPTDDAESGIEYWLQQFGEWILSNFQKEYDYQTSDESIDENIRLGRNPAGWETSQC